MFGQRKKAEGFEWHKYVRTTIKLRREARREKVDRFKRSAAEGAKAAGDAAGSMAKQGAQQFAAGAKVAGGAAGFMAQESVRHFASGARVAGSAAGTMVVNGARWLAATAKTLGLGLAHHIGVSALAAGRIARAGTSAAGRGLIALFRSEPMRPLLDVLGRPGVSAPLALAGFIALLAGLARAVLGFGFNTETGIALLFGLACLFAAYGPRSLLGTAPALPRWLARIEPAVRRRVSYACVAVLLGAAAWSLAPSRLILPGVMHVTGSLPLIGGRTVEGRAVALTGDLLRIGPTIVKLAGIEVPEREQRCRRPGNQRWRCAEAAHDALARLTRGRVLKCDIKSPDEMGRAGGVCFHRATDIGAALVKNGHAFAEQGFLARYARLEAEAQAAKIGLWSGEAERPGNFRARAWEEAKRSAPDGCPIKGQVAGGAKVYVLPWAPDYGRVRVSRARGGRWFCSEQEAIAAGWERG